MISLLLAAFFFVGIHVFVSGTSLRAAIVEKTGEPVYQTAFSLVSLLGLIWLGVAYAAAEPAELWEPAAWLRPITHLLTLIASSSLRSGSRLQARPRSEARRRSVRVSLPVASCASRVIRFSGASLSGRWRTSSSRQSWPRWSSSGLFCCWRWSGHPRSTPRGSGCSVSIGRQFAESTSSVPFLAISQGRNTLELAEIGWWRVALGLVLYAVFRRHPHLAVRCLALRSVILRSRVTMLLDVPDG